MNGGGDARSLHWNLVGSLYTVALGLLLRGMSMREGSRWSQRDTKRINKSSRINFVKWVEERLLYFFFYWAAVVLCGSISINTDPGTQWSVLNTFNYETTNTTSASRTADTSIGVLFVCVYLNSSFFLFVVSYTNVPTYLLPPITSHLHIRHPPTTFPMSPESRLDAEDVLLPIRYNSSIMLLLLLRVCGWQRRRRRRRLGGGGDRLSFRCSLFNSGAPEFLSDYLEIE